MKKTWTYCDTGTVPELAETTDITQNIPASSASTSSSYVLVPVSFGKPEHIKRTLGQSPNFEVTSDESRHQWLDEKGWDIRKCYVLTNDTIHSIAFQIAKTRDGRNILYDVVRNKKNDTDNEKGILIDKNATESLRKRAVKVRTPNGDIVSRSGKKSSSNSDVQNSTRDDLEDGELFKAVTSDEEKQLVDYFGTTTDYNEAGYLLKDGTLLDFSDKRNGGEAGTRIQDHREAKDVLHRDGYSADVPERPTQNGASFNTR